jgi:hypothetical protein
MAREYGWQNFLNEALDKASEAGRWDLAEDLKNRGAEEKPQENV